MQREITAAGPLLRRDGTLAERGWARRPLLEYRRSAVRAGALRIKEWDYYLILNDRFALALTIADNGYLGLDSISFLDFGTGFQRTRSPMRPVTLGRTGLPQSSVFGDAGSGGRRYAILFENRGERRILTAHMDGFDGHEPLDAHVVLTDEPAESMVIATPFPNAQKAFYYNRKIVGMRAEGTVELGSRIYRFDPANSFATLDWGRGVWTYKNTWYWSGASGLADGVPFGFNLGYGFGDTTAATENVLFYGGRANKLEDVTFCIPQKNGKDEFMSTWNFTSSDDRFEAAFVPMLDRAAHTNLGVLESDQHQVFGRFTGRAVLDDGKEISLHNLIGFAEKVRNKW